MQKNVKKCRKMSKNAEKFQKIPKSETFGNFV
jgi:hypothetical protein